MTVAASTFSRHQTISPSSVLHIASTQEKAEALLGGEASVVLGQVVDRLWKEGASGR